LHYEWVVTFTGHINSIFFSIFNDSWVQLGHVQLNLIVGSAHRLT
jgi:hypothetical protein